ncbi:amidohydrolase family protein [Microbacterium sp. 3J1]|uniref:amidohydrolase family protein n=1 Tax=Microbacterium sp. 3J1 TaxID=861269 RepID=UPI000A73CB7C|nr:amidohydrolase family protein [Microbacterium sp. 3J1]
MIADRIVVGSRIRTREGDVGPGHVIIADGRIVATGRDRRAPREYVGPRTEVHDAGGGSVIAGFHDHHTFFTSQLLENAGLDAAALSDDDVRALLAQPGEPVFIRGADDERMRRLARAFGSGEARGDVVVRGIDPQGLLLSSVASARLGNPDPSSNEDLAGLYAQLAREPDAVRSAFASAAQRMHRGGVTSVKDIAFDTHLGMLPQIDEMLREKALGLRYAFASQPVSARADLEAARGWVEGQAAAGHGGARFHGFKLMTDGSFDEGTADLRSPAGDLPDTLTFDADAVAAEATRILDAGFRLALNADGDAAVRACLQIFAGRRDPLPQGCSISDASLVDPEDATTIAALGLGVEYYTQILRYPGYDASTLGAWLHGSQRARLANLSVLVREGVDVASGSDFPLFEPSLPEALLSSAERILGDGPAEERRPSGEGVARDRVVSIWTDERGGFTGDRNRGALERGYAADVVIFDRDLLAVATEELVGATPSLVLAAGEVVHAR